MSAASRVRSVKLVVFVSPYPIFGGPHNQALRLRAALASRGYDLLVLLPDEPGNAVDRLREGGVPVIQVPIHRIRALSNLRGHVQLLGSVPKEIRFLRDLLHYRKADLLLVGGLTSPHVAVAARLAKVPIAWQILDTRSPPLARMVLMMAVLRLADSLMFCGNGLLRTHLGKRQPRQRVTVYYPPVDTDRFKPSGEARTETRRSLGIPSDAPLIGLVGNLNPQKGIEYFIRAAAVISQNRPDTWFVVAGASYANHERYTAKLMAELAQSGIPRNQFLFMGASANLPPLYAALDLKLISSVPRSEGVATTALEAMSCGVPVVSTDVGALSEVIEDGVTGLVVPALSPGALANASLRLIGNANLRMCMGQESRRRAVQRFDVEVCADAHVSAFEAALART